MKRQGPGLLATGKVGLGKGVQASSHEAHSPLTTSQSQDFLSQTGTGRWGEGTRTEKHTPPEKQPPQEECRPLGWGRDMLPSCPAGVRMKGAIGWRGLGPMASASAQPGSSRLKILSSLSWPRHWSLSVNVGQPNPNWLEQNGNVLTPIKV